VHGCQDIGPDYAITLRAWREAWEARQPEVLALGYSQRFWRKYRFYFAYCEAAFDARYIHTFQVTCVKDKEPTLTPEDMQRSSECACGAVPCCAVRFTECGAMLCHAVRALLCGAVHAGWLAGAVLLCLL
jgi:hypothetical protein